MNFLRQSTAVDIGIGPFVDATDGVTAETGLTISQADVRLKKNNGAWAQVNDNTSATHEENGWYEKELDATDTNTVGILLIAVHESGALPVWHEFQVLEEAVYDALFAASAVGPLLANSDGSGLTAINLPNQTMDIVGNITGNLSGSVGSVTGAVGSVTAVSAGAINEASFATTAGSVAPLGIIDQGTAQSATGTTLVLRSAAAFADDELIGATIVITGGSAGVGQARTITDYVSTTDTATVEAWTTTPTGTITYKIFATAPSSGGAPSAATIADAVWDELLSGHAVSGSSGEALSAAGTAGDPWTTALPGAYGSGTAGKIIGDNINATISSRATQTSVDAVDDLVDTELAAVKTVVDSILVDTAEIGAAGAGLTVLATQASVTAIDDLLDTEMPALTTAVADLPTNAELATALGTADDAVLAAVATVDTVVDAIKAKTDSLTFTVAGKVDANITHVIADPVQVNGATDTNWGGAP
jgi:hypothetical protein